VATADSTGSARIADRLPEFPWDVLAPYGATARRHPEGLVDVSVGTPVDPTPDIVQSALAAAADAPGYPTTAGTEELRRSCTGWMRRSLACDVDVSAVLPGIGSKELVASIPRLLGLTAGSRVAIPRIAYPTYAVGVLLADGEPIATDEPESLESVAAVWLNPTGAVLSAERLAEIVGWAREAGAVVLSDECYIELGWEAEPVSILHPTVCGGSHEGLLAVHSLSKRSNLAGYRFGFVAGDPRLVGDLLEVRKHSGMMVPAPVQAAAVAALDDDVHVGEQRARYAARRDVLRAALEHAGFRIDDSQAGLYLWATRDEPCWDTVGWFAGLGILVTPGDFYGPAGGRHVRVALTVSDDGADAFARRLRAA
jgi:succinyldiaminopimelate transaminase